MKAKDKKAIFIFQITEEFLKVIKCSITTQAKREFLGLECESLPPDIDEKGLRERLTRILKKLDYKSETLIIPLPRNKATCRYLKIPTQVPGEIERIANLQASRFLPYPPEELISGYQVIQADKDGYTDINLTIVHKELIERYLNIIKELKAKDFAIILSSYAIVNLYDYIKSQDSETTMVVDVDNYQIELVIARDKKMLFSRNFKLNRLKPDWEGAFIDEINKSRDAYLKEVGREAPSKIAILGAEKLCQLFAEVLKKQLTLPIKILSTSSKLRFSNNLSNDILNSDNSFTALIGLGLSGIEESINLLPQNIKERNFRLSQRKSQLRLISLMGAIILIWVFAIARNLDNKARYLKQLKLELSKISQEARPLEEFEKRFQLLESRLKKKPSTLDIIHELYQVIPEGVSLTNLSYDEDKEIILRGTTPELNYVFKFASQLENSAIFSKFNIKVRYATKKKTQAGEIVDYEIVCLKKS